MQKNAAFGMLYELASTPRTDDLKKETKAMSFLLQLHGGPLKEVMYFSLSEGSLVFRQVCKITRQAVDEVISTLWNRIKVHPLEGGIPLLKLMLQIESKNGTDKALIAFKELNQQIKLQYDIKFESPTVPIFPWQFADIQTEMQQQQNDNLMKIWIGFKANSSKSQAIPDLGSAEEIREFLNNPTTSKSLSTITVLNLRQYRLTEVFGLNVLTQLRALFLDFNDLKTISDLSALTQLRTLYLGSNQLKAIPDLSALVELQELYLESNKLITTPDLSALTQLEELSFENNQLKTIFGLSALTNLQGLSLSDNQLTEIPGLSALTQLQRLSIENNQLIEAPDLSALTQLEELSIGGNHWMFIPENMLKRFQDLPEIKRFISELNYNAQTPFACFYQLVIRQKSSEDEIRKSFAALPDKDKNSVYELVSALSGMPLNNLFQDMSLVFANMSVFYRALQKAIFSQFENLSQTQKTALFEKLYELAGPPEADDLEKWGNRHAFENIPLLADALALRQLTEPKHQKLY